MFRYCRFNRLSYIYWFSVCAIKIFSKHNTHIFITWPYSIPYTYMNMIAFL